jgi:hypothetical protein
MGLRARAVTVVNADGSHAVVPPETLKPGMRFVVAAGERIAADGHAFGEARKRGLASRAKWPERFLLSTVYVSHRAARLISAAADGVHRGIDSSPEPPNGIVCRTPPLYGPEGLGRDRNTVLQ